MPGCTVGKDPRSLLIMIRIYVYMLTSSRTGVRVLLTTPVSELGFDARVCFCNNPVRSR